MEIDGDSSSEVLGDMHKVDRGDNGFSTYGYNLDADVNDGGALGSRCVPTAWHSDNKSPNHDTMELSVFIRAARAKTSALEGTSHSLGGGMGVFGSRTTPFGRVDSAVGN